MILIVQFLLILILIAIIGILLYAMVRGAPYAPLGKQKIETMLKLLNVKSGEKAVDLGSGDGRIVVGMAKKGAIAHGYEINPLLVLIAKWKIKKLGLQNNAHIYWGDFWGKNLSSFDIVTVYLAPHSMKPVEEKIRRELKSNARVAVNYSPFPTWKPKKTLEKIYLYQQ
jgi:ubiquinone/menaquinone biosynthesis C-methylase UbiE